jgi:hypothetical protein
VSGKNKILIVITTLGFFFFDGVGSFVLGQKQINVKMKKTKESYALIKEIVFGEKVDQFFKDIDYTARQKRT